MTEHPVVKALKEYYFKCLDTFDGLENYGEGAVEPYITLEKMKQILEETIGEINGRD